jgi:CrcB protein
MVSVWISATAVSLGAGIGALLRWQLAARFDTTIWSLPLGTLLANWIGAFLIGIAMAWISNDPRIPEHWRLFVMTGFLGGLTTFSTFSAEVVVFVQEGRWLSAATEILAHVAGSVVFTLLGLASFALFRDIHSLKP